jgi:ABC-type sulfate/molybdate transport systems ATPase subunit
LQLADRVAVLNHGILEQIGTPDEVEKCPVSPFVMTFLGEAHSIPAEIVTGRL